MTESIAFRTAQKRIALLWYIGVGLLFIILIIQSSLGRYGESLEQVWGWFLPAVMPTVSLITAVLVTELSGPTNSRLSDKFLYRLALISSGIYVGILHLAVFITPVMEGEKTAIEILQASQLWLAPVQGIVAAVLGAYFVRQKEEPTDKEPTDEETTNEETTND